MDKTRKTFDDWATNGRSEKMEKEHKKSVMEFLDGVRLRKQFSFLDIGCGNGWVVREMAQLQECKKAVGIDKSPNMIKNAISKSESKKETFECASIEDWKYRGRFDYIFAMESVYYSDSVKDAVARIFGLLKDGGRFFCGTDYYKDNKATAIWSDAMKIPMHLLSEAEWKKIFTDAGFQTRTKHITDPKSNKKWRRDYGTLFVIGKKPS